MLNAFRHHGERDYTDLCRDCYAVLCSTPSGITASGTSFAVGNQEFLEQVLNAFRHHGERDRVDDGDGFGWLQVLNAFRHHGERDAPAYCHANGATLCSTPSGITASGTPRRAG